MHKTALLLLLPGVLLLLSACGFHLRGPVGISEALSPLYIEPAQLNTDEQRLLKEALNRAGARLSDFSEKANRLEVSFSPAERRNLAQSSPSGVQLVQLSLQLTYRVRNVEGEVLMDSRQLTHTTELELDNSNVLSHQKLVQDGMERLQQKLVRSMIYQLKR